MTELHGDEVTLRPAVTADAATPVAIRSTPEVRARWRGDDRHRGTVWRAN